MRNGNFPPHPFVFFSYPSEDRAVVLRLESDLQAYGVNAWTGQDIGAATDWHEEIKKAIQAADAVIFLLAPHGGSSSSRVRDELQIARAYQRSVLSFRVGGTESPSSQTQLKAGAERNETRYEHILSAIVHQLTALGLVESGPSASTSPASTPNETSFAEIHEADYERVMAFFEELEPHYSKTNRILADL